jgi:hypothetical protein
VIVPHRPIRTGDELTLITLADARMAQEVKLEELREADKLIPKEPDATTAPPAMQQLPRQAPPRAQSREITPLWEVTKPPTCDHGKRGDGIPVVLQIVGDQISERTRRKAYLCGFRNESWEIPIEIHPDVQSVTVNQVVPCRVRYLSEHETPTSTRCVLHVTPRILL